MAKHFLTGEDDEADGPTKSIISRDGALGPILGDPASRAALLQIGLQMMQPMAMGQSVAGHIGQSVAGGGDVEARLSKEDFERQKHEDELDKSNQTLAIRRQEADAYTKAQETAGVRAASYDRAALEQLKQSGREKLAAAKNFSALAKSEFDAVNDFAFNPKDPAQADRLKYVGKTQRQIEQMMAAEDAAAGGGGGGAVEPPPGGAGPPASALKEGIHTTFKNGEVWTLQSGRPVKVR